MSDLRSHVLAQLEAAYGAFQAHGLKATTLKDARYIEACIRDYRHSGFTQSLEDGMAVHAFITARTLKAHRVAFVPYVAPVAQPAQEDAGADPCYNTARFPFFVCSHGNWDIYANASGYCASIPTTEARANGCKATHFGDSGYVRSTLGVDVHAAIASGGDAVLLADVVAPIVERLTMAQPVQQAQGQDTRAASPILQRLAEAQAELDRFGGSIHGLRWNRLFDKRESLKAMAVQADPVAYVRAYPSHAFAYRHLLPSDMVARIEAAETDAAMIEAVREPAPTIDRNSADAIATVQNLDHPAPISQADAIADLRATADRLESSGDLNEAINLRILASRLTVS